MKLLLKYLDYVRISLSVKKINWGTRAVLKRDINL